jgi:hypothetical protein
LVPIFGEAGERKSADSLRFCGERVEIGATILQAHAELGIARFVSGFGAAKTRGRSFRRALFEFIAAEKFRR